MTGWHTVKLETIADVIDSLHQTPKYSETGYPMVRVTDIKKGSLDLSATLKVTKELFEKFSKNHTPQKGDIVFSRVGSYGNTSFVNTDEEFCLGQNTAFISPKQNPLFLYYFLNSPAGINEIESSVAGSTQPTVSLKSIRNFDIPNPPLSEQKAIAAVLSSLDDKIDLLHRQNKTLEAMAATLFRQWFVEEAQEDWKTGKLGEEFDFTMGQSPSGSSFNEDRVGVPMFQGNADFEFRFPKERIYTTEPTRFAQKFDTLISVRAPVGDQNMAHKKCCIGRGVAAFRYKANNDFYTYTYFKLRSLMEEIKKFNDEGTVFGSISKSDFDALGTIIPPPELVVQFEKDAKPINNKVIENCAQIQTLATLRDTLLPKLMSGEVRVVA